MKGVVILCLFFCCGLTGLSNNVRFGGTVKVTDVTGGVATLEIDLSWENSWRDNFNWDAVWLFLKVKPAGGAWSHVNLQDVKHAANGDFEVMNGKSGSNVAGVYVYRNRSAAGNASTKLTLKYACGGYTKADFEKNRVFLLAQAIEMAYIPYGAYYLGDGRCANRFTDATGQPVVIDSEDARSGLEIRDNGLTGTPANVSAAYPHGYQGFYVMKYELSQEQYVSFLNTLSRTEQETLLGAPHFSGLSVGDYLFGAKSKVDNRNGIVLSGKPTGQPYLFDHDLNGNKVKGEAGDGQSIACNYLSIADLLAYAAWSGLRPMSELEYERACRAPYPQEVLPGEYVWNTATGIVKATGINSGGKETELAGIGANVNSGTALGGLNSGPLRCGVFATSTSSQPGAGATYWGVMEMGGNVRELVAGVANTSLNKATNGVGAFSTSLWSVTPAHYGVRGGGFTSPDSLLRTSDRSEMKDYFSVITTRDSTVGFRLTRTLDVGSVKIDPKTIALSGTACPGEAIVTGPEATADMPDVPFSYLWYVNGVLVPGCQSAELRYKLATNTSYTFLRKAICAVGEASSPVLNVTVPNAVLTLSTYKVMVNVGNYAPTVTATPAIAASSYVWSYEGTPIPGFTGNSYTASRSHFGTQISDFRGIVECAAVLSGCTVRAPLEVEVPFIRTVSSEAVTSDNCGKVIFYDDRDGDRKTYCTVKIGAQCWMGTNLNVGTFTEISASDYWMFDKVGIQKWCLGGVDNSYISNESQCVVTGGLYEWWEMICGGDCQGKMTAANAQIQYLSSESELRAYGAKMVPNSSTLVQGICPDGWHIPTVAEWGVLGSNRDGWGALLGGFRGNNGSGYLGSQGDWWSSTPTSSYYAWFRYLASTADGTALDQSYTSRSNGFSVRCLRN